MEWFRMKFKSKSNFQVYNLQAPLHLSKVTTEDLFFFWTTDEKWQASTISGLWEILWKFWFNLILFLFPRNWEFTF